MLSKNLSPSSPSTSTSTAFKTSFNSANEIVPDWVLSALENARFRQQVVPGDTLKLQVEVLRLSARGGKASGEAFVNGNLACSAELMFIAVEK